MWILYQVAIGLALVTVGPVLLARRGRHYLASLAVRLGRFPAAAATRPLWLHAVSVGEVGVASTLAATFSPELPLVVTTTTPSGQSRARATLGDRARVTYLPFDLGFAVNRFFERFRPAVLVLVEGDLWPLVLRRARRGGLPVAVVNGRVGDASFRRLRFLKGLLGPLLGPVDLFAVQSAADRERLLALGVEARRVVVTGNLKFETAEPATDARLEAALAGLAAGRPILAAGSTMSGEEERVLEAFAAAGGGKRAMLLLAPRHPERWDEVERLARRGGWKVARRSDLSGERRPDLLLLDSMGELAALYRLAAAAFVGGTLVPTGGHNPLEAARHGVAVVAGPSMENFRAIAEAFDRAGAWRRVADADDLAATWRGWLDRPAEARRLGERGRALLDEHRGASRRTLAALEPLLEAAGLRC